MHSSSSIRGNVLFIILIAIALFAAVSFAMTRTTGSSSNAMTKEAARLTADEMVQYGNGLRIIIDRMMLLNGVSDANTSGNGILFSATGADAGYGVPGAQPATEIFNSAGGQATYQTPPPAACLSTPCAYEFSGQYTITGAGSDSKAELVMLVIDIDPNVCAMANTLLNNGLSTIPTGGALTLVRFNGVNYTELGGANPITLGGASFTNNRAFCYQESGGAGRYIYVHVVRAR